MLTGNPKVTAVNQCWLKQDSWKSPVWKRPAASQGNESSWNPAFQLPIPIICHWQKYQPSISFSSKGWSSFTLSSYTPLLLFFFFYHKVSCILGCSRTHCVAVAALELTIFPCPPPGITHLDHHDQFISKFLLKVTLFSLKSQRSILKFYLKKTKQIN